MAKEDVSKIKDIANHFCNMSLDEILKLLNPEGYEFIDGFFDRAFPITEDFRSCKGELKMIPFEVWSKKVVVKQQDADKFNERRVKLIAKFIKDYKEIVKESFGDQASEVERFNSWLDSAVTKFTKSYEAKLRDVFGDSAYQIMPKPNIRDLSDKIFYHSRIFHSQVIKR